MDHQTTEIHKFQITEINESFDEAAANATTAPAENGHQSRQYLVEEPDNYDYIFEPGHYPDPHSQGEAEASNEFEASSKPKAIVTSEEKYKNGVKFLKRVARMVSENDGVLEYEYKSNADIRGSMSDDEEFFENYFHDFDYKHYHLNAVIRSISLSKCPGTPGFGFQLARHTENDEDLFYVSEVTSETPAELCLRLGDVMIELDEKNPRDMFKSLEECHEYLSSKDSVHMMVIHESNYFRLKSRDEGLIERHCINCEDMVIVKWNKEFEANLIQ